MKIGDVARAAGLKASAIRYYEAVGVLPPARRKNGVREYEPDMVDELKVLRFCRASGIPIRRLGSLAKHPRGSSSRRAAWDQMLESRIADLDTFIGDAQQARRELERAIECRCAGKRDDCTVIRAADEMA